MSDSTAIKKLGILSSLAIYISAAALMFCLTKYLIPYLSEITGQEPVIFWFIVAGLGIFTPLITTGILILKKEGYKLNRETWIHRLRFRKISKSDVIWSVGGLIVVGILSGVVMKVMEAIIGQFDHSPSFMTFEPLTQGRYWILLLWFPYWLLNIFGEEFLWRGVMLPRQEVAFGKYTWLIHGTGWGLFHVAFGWHLMITSASLDLHSIVHRPEEKEFMDWRHDACRFEWTEFYCYFVGADLNSSHNPTEDARRASLRSF
jgi:membrane protease YdiL (CAAX protease family)